MIPMHPHRLWANGVLSGIMFLQFWTWWTHSAATERMLIKCIVVSHSSLRQPAVADVRHQYFTAFSGLAQTVL